MVVKDHLGQELKVGDKVLSIYCKKGGDIFEETIKEIRFCPRSVRVYFESGTYREGGYNLVKIPKEVLMERLLECN